MKTAKYARLAMAFFLIVLLVGCGGAKKSITSKETIIQISKDSGQYEPPVTDGILAEVGDPEQLTNGYADNGIGNYHPDGDKIIFQSNRDGNWQLYELNISNGEINRFIESESNDENPIWLSDGEALLFVSDVNGENEWDRDIYMYDPDEDVVLPVTNEKGDDWYPIDPDADGFYYLTERESNLYSSIYEKENSVFRGTLDGNMSYKVAGSGKNFRAPTVIDENRLVVLTDSDRPALYTIDSNQLEYITPGKIKCGTSTHNKNRNLLAFSGEQEGRLSLYLLDLKSNILQQITHGNLEIRYPRFSPDGKWLLYSVEIAGYYQMFRRAVEIPEVVRASPVEETIEQEGSGQNEPTESLEKGTEASPPPEDKSIEEEIIVDDVIEEIPDDEIELPAESGDALEENSGDEDEIEVIEEEEPEPENDRP